MKMWILGFLTILVINAIVLYFFVFNKRKKDSRQEDRKEEKMDTGKEETPAAEPNVEVKECEYEPIDTRIHPVDMMFEAGERDMMTMYNPLLPMLNRPNLPHGTDMYRMVGYLVGEESDEKWQLFGREGLSRKGEFYVKPVDRNIEMKISLTNDMMPNLRKRLKSVDDLPENIVIDHPLFDTQTYKVTSIPFNHY